MEEQHWNIDEQLYIREPDQNLLLRGWYLEKEEGKGKLSFWADGQKLEVLAEEEHFKREDVTNTLPEAKNIKEPGFSVNIVGIEELLKSYQHFELHLDTDEETEVLWKMDKKCIEEIIWKNMIEYFIDKEEITDQNIWKITGWVLNQSEIDLIEIRDDNNHMVPCKVVRRYRPDIVAYRNLNKNYENKEMGFDIEVKLEKCKKRYLTICFCGEDCQTKKYREDIWQMKWEKTKRKISHIFGKKELDNLTYKEWFLEQAVDKKTLRRQRKTRFPYMPCISIVIPLYNTPITFFEELLHSIEKQSYKNWQLCLADGSDNDEIQKYLKKHYIREKRITYKKLKENRGISENTNEAIDLAVGEYIMLCDHDDLVEPDALFEIVRVLNRKKQADIVYTDEDKISMDGKEYFEPNMKSDFNLFALRDNNYICHIFVVRRDLLEKVGKFQKEYDGAQDFDLILRCTEKARTIVHIPKVLYHWRCHKNSTAANPESKGYAFEAGRKAVQAHYDRMGIEAKVESTDYLGRYRSHVKIKGSPIVSIIIPNKDHIEDLNLCISSIYEKTTYKNYEILIVENNSTDQKTFSYYKKLEAEKENLQVLYWNGEFNYSAINNFAVKEAKGEYLLFLNNDVSVITPEWIEEMLQICQQKEVGAVGAKLYYPDNTIQHAGVVLGMGGIAGHILCTAYKNDPGYMGRLISVQEYSAVTAACMMVKKKVFDVAGGFEETFKVAFNDIDLCMKIRKAHKKIVFTPYAELYHYESKSRGLEDTPEKQTRFAGEIQKFSKKWEKELKKGDPYYNPNLSLKKRDCSIRMNKED